MAATFQLDLFIPLRGFAPVATFRGEHPRQLVKVVSNQLCVVDFYPRWNSQSHMPPLTGQQVWGPPRGGTGEKGVGEGDFWKRADPKWHEMIRKPIKTKLIEHKQWQWICPYFLAVWWWCLWFPSDVRSVDVVIPLLRHTKPYSVYGSGSFMSEDITGRWTWLFHNAWHSQEVAG